MIYEVKRTSQACEFYDAPTKPMPCEEARLADGIWYVEFRDLLDLAAFVAKYGMVVLGNKTIEIYDSWRE